MKQPITTCLTLAMLLFGVSCSEQNSKEPNIPFVFGQGYGLNSTTLIVKDIDQAISFYTDTLGFDIPNKTEKGIYDGTIVSSASFPDRSDFEILALDDSLSDLKPLSFLDEFSERNEGVRLYAFSTSSADSTSSWLSSQGFKIDSIQSYRTSNTPPEGWSWDDGAPQIRSLDFESSDPPAKLPRFIQQANTDYNQLQDEWRTFYSFWRSFTEHPNGVVGMSAIKVVVEDLQESTNHFESMGLKPLNMSDTSTQFDLFRHQKLHLVAANSSEELSDFMSSRGEGVFAIQFDVANLDSTSNFLRQKLPPEAFEMSFPPKPSLTVLASYAYGVQLEFVQEPEEQGLMARQLSPNDQLDSAAILHAENLYTKYCALCHGDNREGYAADNAPSLRSKSLLGSSKSNNFMRYTIQYGRSETAMAGYLKSQGGPMEYIDIELLLQWLNEKAEVEEPIELSRQPVQGDIELGATVYAENCATCHGENGEGVTAPALGHPLLLATATDHFLRYAISEGRDGTPMIGFKDSLSEDEINGVTAFLRTRASGWDIPSPDTVSIPSPEDYVLNPENETPDFALSDGRYLSAEQLLKALQDSAKIVVLDARSEVAWRQMHIPGSIPVPYYEEPESFIEYMPSDSTWIVAYCACPHAASNKVVNTLRRYGFKKTAVMDEGILVWGQLGYPVKNGN